MSFSLFCPFRDEGRKGGREGGRVAVGIREEEAPLFVLVLYVAAVMAVGKALVPVMSVELFVSCVCLLVLDPSERMFSPFPIKHLPQMRLCS